LSPYSGTGRLQQKERDFITLASEADVYLFNLKQIPRTAYTGQHIFTNKQRLSASPCHTNTHLRDIPGIQHTFCIQFLGNIYNCHLTLSECTETPLCYLRCIFLQQAPRSSTENRKTDLLSVLHWPRRCRLIHLSLHHGSFQALVQVSITIYLKGILTKGFDLGKSVAWMMETTQKPWASSREQEAPVNSRVCRQHQLEARSVRTEPHTGVCTAVRASLLTNKSLQHLSTSMYLIFSADRLY